jgi:transposase-like protein
MIKCYQCGCERCVKSGFMQGQQRYKCKECGYNFVNKPRRGHSQATIAFAVWLNISGMSQRRIARLIGVSPVAVRKWIKSFALKNAPKPVPPEGSVAVVGLDEMWHFLKKSSTKSGSGMLFVVIQNNSLPGNAGIVIGPR